MMKVTRRSHDKENDEDVQVEEEMKKIVKEGGMMMTMRNRILKKTSARVEIIKVI